MPLMHKRSQKAFEHNIKAEMEAGKPQKQSLAIAYSVKRKAKKASGGMVKSGSPDMNMAKGGMVNESAKSEHRPMPSEMDNDAAEVRRNKGDKAPSQDKMTDQPERKQSTKGGVFALKEPKIMEGATFKSKKRDAMDEMERDEERHLMDSDAPASPDEQPNREKDEEGPDRQGDKVPDMQDEHSTRRKPYAKGGEIEASDEEKHPDSMYEDDLQDLDPSEDEGLMMADDHDEMGPDRQGDKVSDMEEPHNADEDKAYGYADGGSVHNEEELEHAASLAAAIMAKRRMMARGGPILSEDSMESDDSDMADLNRNAEEDANMEDKASFDSLRKENYSERSALEEAKHPEDSNMHSPEHEPMDIHDSELVNAIRRKMRMKSPITR
jgi:hypothetical protein